MKKMLIKLTPEKHMVLKEVMDRALDEDFENPLLQELWHACARAEAVEEPEITATPA